MDFRAFLQNNRVYLDGGTGTLLQQAGLSSGELPERWNVTHADVIEGLHKAYFDAGSNVVAANTFGANTIKFPENELSLVIAAAIRNAKRAAVVSSGMQEKFVALDIGPTGKLLKPYGTLDFDDAVEIFAKTVRIGAQNGADLILIETMSDCYEMKAAVLAAKENCDLPILVSNAYESNGKLMTGASPKVLTAMLEGLGVDGFGANCSLGPQKLEPVVETLLDLASLPVLVKPNAGLPVTENGVTRYDVDAETFAEQMQVFAKAGARILGSCCGTTPAYIKALVEKTSFLPLPTVEKKQAAYVSSYIRAIDPKTASVGTAVNVPKDARMRQAVQDGDWDAVIDEAFDQKAEGVDVLYINVDGAGAENALSQCMESLQEVIDLPLFMESNDLPALERAMRRYNGTPYIRLASGQTKADVLPLLQKYGGVLAE